MTKNFSALLLAGVALGGLIPGSSAQAQLLGGATPTPALDDSALYDEGFAPVEGLEVDIAPHSDVIQPFSGITDWTESFGDIIQPFTGDVIQPFNGDVIQPFNDGGESFGDVIQPFSGDIMSWWGEGFGDIIQPFNDGGESLGDVIQPFDGGAGFGDVIQPFSDVIQPFDGSAESLGLVGRYWNNFNLFWRETTPLWDDPAQASSLGAKLDEMMDQTRLAWGESIGKATGKSFEEAFKAPLFARYGIDPANPGALQQLSAPQRARFLVDWYDSLMGYTGIDRVDHWMADVRWTPSVTRIQGSGADSIIGLIDATALGDPDIADNIIYNGGGSAKAGGHGVGVASLMVAAHDGKGVMGIAPNARVVAFNPFDSQNKSNFASIKAGILALGQRGASVINMSLGVSGYTLHPDFGALFADRSVAAYSSPAMLGAKLTYVLAAGNDGLAQTTNVAWGWRNAPALILVGSVDPSGTISRFSNTPGNACLLEGGVCRTRLMDMFMVAPGEVMLVPDGNGGFHRVSGTSFAAPLVSGAITLLHDRWPWLANKPKETVDILLRSARDLGAPGTDAVYGRGMLDVTASQSPLDFNALRFFKSENGSVVGISAAMLQAEGVQTTWEADKVFFYLFEPIGSTFRDFTVPMSKALVGKVGGLTGAQEYFQSFITQRMKDWIGGAKTQAFTDVATFSGSDRGGWQASISSVSPRAMVGRHGLAPTPQSWVRFAAPNSRFAINAGLGEGAMAMNGLGGLGLSSDYGREGGVNPLLGLASGGAFASFDAALGGRTTLSLGWTSQEIDHRHTDYASTEQQLAYEGVDDFKANAFNLRLSHRPIAGVTLSAAFARVNERNGLLGVQSRYSADLDRGAVSNTLTLGASAEAGNGLTLAVSATAGRTRSGGDEQGFATEGAGVVSTAFALAATKQAVFGRDDRIRLSVSQPLHIEQGQLRYTSLQVIDRASGELGVVDQSFSVAGKDRPYTAEMLYAAPFMADAGELGLFGRGQIGGSGPGANQVAAGARMRLSF